MHFESNPLDIIEKVIFNIIKTLFLKSKSTNKINLHNPNIHI